MEQKKTKKERDNENSYLRVRWKGQARKLFGAEKGECSEAGKGRSR